MAYGQQVSTPAFFDTHVAPPTTPLPSFTVVRPDKKLSPFTGLTRRHWQDAARYLLSGAFSYVHTLNDPMQFPKQPGKSYPRNAESQVPTEKLEGLCRTLFMAAPLAERRPWPDAERHQSRRITTATNLAQLVNPASPSFIQPTRQGRRPLARILVEFGGLSVALFAAPEILWDPLPQATKECPGRHHAQLRRRPHRMPQNWRYFNIFILSFYKSRGLSRQRRS